ncbi:hypothetical protein FPOAC1_010635 [Fusarium poae]|uniref:hypothetical protein n=1 Tax=Fusarium poae TaxID=36050 RepID=UPI001CE8C735|nr:hypothetical protein FPOAC1_010635 [Fusarium poae]KAG8665834.1 hypothetical protein FPOAC1_010635 [Fusarium poae]
MFCVVLSTFGSQWCRLRTRPNSTTIKTEKNCQVFILPMSEANVLHVTETMFPLPFHHQSIVMSAANDGTICVTYEREETRPESSGYI